MERAGKGTVLASNFRGTKYFVKTFENHANVNFRNKISSSRLVQLPPARMYFEQVADAKLSM